MYETRDDLLRRFRADAARYQTLKDTRLTPQDALMRMIQDGANDIERLNAVRIAEDLSLREAKAFKETTEAWRSGRISAEQYKHERRRAIEIDPGLARLMDEN